MQNVNLIFPHQLFKTYLFINKADTTYLVEEFLFFKLYLFHKQKIRYHRVTMQQYFNYLLQLGVNINYLGSDQPISDVRLLISNLNQQGFKKITIIDVADNWLLQRISNSCNKYEIELEIIPSPMFLNTEKTLESYFPKHKNKFLQTDFYKQERIKQQLLLTPDGKPLGGQWTYDVDNRKKYPKNKAVIAYKFPENNKFWTEGTKYTERYFFKNYGALNQMALYPSNFKEAEDWLEQFLDRRMADFGEFEDAILQNEMIINHSVLTPMLNIGLLTPQQILTATLNKATVLNYPLNSLEGFIRQIIGWREFLRGIYIYKGTQQRNNNFWNFKRKLPPSFYTGTTGILPVDTTIKKVLQTGYCHHIERLMILGNFMLLCEFDPNEVYQWFMELFIDAYDWVMVPNVYGMSQFADGGILASKPYISGSNYIMKMSDYPKGNWQETWDALFWRFLDNHRSFFKTNPRLSMLINTYDKWEPTKKETIQQVANQFLLNLNAE